MQVFDFDPYNLFLTFLVTVVIQALCFLFAALFKTDKITDISYSLTFVFLALMLLALSDLSPVQWLIAGAVTVWGLRLGGYLFYRIIRMGRDKRFDGIREKFFSFLMFWVFQAAVVWLCMLPATIALSIGDLAAPDWLVWLGAGMWLVGFAIEAVADQQKFAFKNDPTTSSRWIESGLWKYSRHPNYFGEVLLWWGVFVMSLPALTGSPLLLAIGLLGPVCITGILLFFSGIPPLEKKYAERYGDDPAYQTYRARTSLFVPLPPRKSDA